MNRGVATKDCLGIAELGGHVQSLKDFSSGSMNFLPGVVQKLCTWPGMLC
jgi:hypothetical protein